MMLSRGFITQQLQRIPSEYGLRLGEHFAWLRCIFHSKGRERTASLRINLDTSTQYKIGSYVCFACNEHGSYDDLRKTFKLKRYKKRGNDDFQREINDEIRQSILGKTSSELNKLAVQIQFAPHWPKKQRWRSINGQLLSALDARAIINKFGSPRMYLPVMQDRAIVGGITCSYSDKVKLKYVYEKGDWIRNTLFPFDYVRKRAKQLKRRGKKLVIFLVEGPRDALNLLQHGLLALAILGGTTVYRNIKMDLLMSLEPDLVCLAFDPDKIGQQVTKLAYNYLHGQVAMKRLKFTIEHRNGKIYKNDAGNMPELRAVKLKKQLAI
jgi:hypothetical protein